MLLELADRLDAPDRPIDLVFTTREEVGCQGSQYYARSTDAVAIVALEVVPVAKEYAIEPGPDPVIIRADSYAPLDDGLSWELADAAAAAGVTVRHAAVTRYGSDASSSLDSGPRAAQRLPGRRHREHPRLRDRTPRRDRRLRADSAQLAGLESRLLAE